MTKSELEILFKTHYAAMFRLAVSLLYDADEARDVVSDVFASLLDGGLAIRTDNARGFLLTCVRNGCINVIRHKQMRERFIRLYSTAAEPQDSGPEDSVMLAELRVPRTQSCLPSCASTSTPTCRRCHAAFSLCATWRT